MGIFDHSSRAVVREHGDIYEEKASRLAEDARLLFQQGRNPDAEEKIRQLIELQARVVGEKHPDYASGLALLAELLIAQDELHDAEVLLQRVQEIRKKALGETHPDYASGLDLLGRLMLRWDDVEGAEPLLRKALEVRRNALGEDHPDFGASLAGLAEALRRREDYETAESLLRQSLTVRRNALGDDHVDVADSLVGLADVQMRLGELDEAEQTLRRAIEVRKVHFGENHPEYLSALSMLAALMQHKGGYDEAEQLWRLLLDTRRQALGERHPECANILTQMSQIRQRRGDLRGAEFLLRQALEIRKHALGDRHPDFAATLTQLGQVLHRAGELAAAEPLLRQALAIRKEVLGSKHPDYAASLIALAALVQKRGDTSWARMLLREAVDVRRAIYGDCHPEYAHALTALADIMAVQGEPHLKVEALYRQALEIRRQTLGEYHPAFAANLSCLAALMRKSGDLAAAESLLREALEIRREVLGEQHPDYVTNLGNLAWVLQNQGDREGAEEFLVRSLEIRRKVLGEQHPEFLQNLDRLAALRAEVESARNDSVLAPRAGISGGSEPEQTLASFLSPHRVSPTPHHQDQPLAAGPHPIDASPSLSPTRQEPQDPYAAAMREIYSDLEDAPPSVDDSIDQDEMIEEAASDPELESAQPWLAAERDDPPLEPLSSDSAEAPDPIGATDQLEDADESIELATETEHPLPDPTRASLQDATGPEPRGIGEIEPPTARLAPLEDYVEEEPDAEEPEGLLLAPPHDTFGHGAAFLPESESESEPESEIGSELELELEPDEEPFPVEPEVAECLPETPIQLASPAPETPEPSVRSTPVDERRIFAEPLAAVDVPTSARSLSMSQSSSDLSQELAAMADRFSELGERLLTAARQLHAPGTPPAEDLLEAVGTCRRDFFTLRDRARGLAGSLQIDAPAAEHLGSLNDVSTLLEHAAEAEIRLSKSEEQRRRALSVLDRVLCLSHVSTPDFAPLRDALDKARSVRTAVAESHWSSLHPEAEKLAEGEHHFANLLTLIEDRDELSDDLWATLHENVGNAFGKSLAAAAARAKLKLPAQHGG